MQTDRRRYHSTLPSMLLEPLPTAGPLGSPDVTPVPRYYGSGRDPLAVHRFPGVSGYTASLLRRFLDGTRRVSPVAQHVLVAVPSLPPRRSFSPHPSVATIRAVFAQQAQARPADLWFSRPLLGSLALRPGNSLTILKMALSIGFRFQFLSFLLSKLRGF